MWPQTAFSVKGIVNRDTVWQRTSLDAGSNMHVDG